MSCCGHARDNHDSEEEEHSQLSPYDDGGGGIDDGAGSISPQKARSTTKLESMCSFCISISSIFCHLCAMTLVTMTQVMTNAALK